MVRSRLVGGLVAGLLVVLTAAGVAGPVAAREPVSPAGTTIFGVSLNLNDCQLFASPVPQSPTADPKVRITLKHGKVLKLKRTVASSGGDLVADLCPVLLQPGDVLSMAANGQTRTITLPTLSGHIDPFTKRASGRAPVSGSLFITVWSCELWPGAGCFSVIAGDPLAVSPKGRWSADLSSHAKWHPSYNDGVDLVLEPEGVSGPDQFELHQVLDTASVRVGSAGITGHAGPRSKVALTLVAPGGAVRATGAAVASGVEGAWKATLRSGSGARVKVRAGDTLRTNLLKTRTRPGASIKAADLTSTVTTDGVGAVNGSAHCAPDLRVGILVHPPGELVTDLHYYEGTGDGNGLVSFTDAVAIPVGWVVEAHCVSAQFMDQVAFGQTVAP